MTTYVVSYMSYSLMRSGMSVVLVMIPGVDSDILEFHVNNISMLIANDRMVTMWFQTNLKVIRKTYYQCSTFIKTGTIV